MAWGVRHYYAMTSDDVLMLDGGLEVVLETANFWSSKVRRDPDATFHLRRVCGPDELHQLVDEDAYTNRMIVELLDAASVLIRRFEKTDGKRVDALFQDRSGQGDAGTLARCGGASAPAHDVPFGLRLVQGARRLPGTEPEVAAIVRSEAKTRG